MALAIGGYVCYHLSQKFLNQDLNPFWIAAVSYTIAACVSWILWVMFRQAGTFKMSVQWPMIGIGFAVVMLDVGFILAYRNGWGLGSAPVFSNVVASLLLLPIGILFFQEGFTWVNFLGFVFCVIGIVFLKHL